MKIRCENCKQTIEIEPYVYGGRIVTERNIRENNASYTAVANVRFICPNCGTTHDYKDIESNIHYTEIHSMIRSKLPHYIEWRADKVGYEER